jgi:hypothetical protein
LSVDLLSVDLMSVDVLSVDVLSVDVLSVDVLSVDVLPWSLFNVGEIIFNLKTRYAICCAGVVTHHHRLVPMYVYMYV